MIKKATERDNDVKRIVTTHIEDLGGSVNNARRNTRRLPRSISFYLQKVFHVAGCRIDEVVATYTAEAGEITLHYVQRRRRANGYTEYDFVVRVETMEA